MFDGNRRSQNRNNYDQELSFFIFRLHFSCRVSHYPETRKRVCLHMVWLKGWLCSVNVSFSQFMFLVFVRPHFHKSPMTALREHFNFLIFFSVSVYCHTNNLFALRLFTIYPIYFSHNSIHSFWLLIGMTGPQNGSPAYRFWFHFISFSFHSFSFNQSRHL